MGKQKFSKNVQKNKKKKLRLKTSKILLIILLIFLFIFGMILGYLSDYSKASDDALAALHTDQTTDISGENPIIFKPEQQTEKEIGIIYYPGGKVDEKAYAPFTKKLAEEGYTVFLTAVPFHLAIFDIDVAEEIINTHPEIDEWYLAGHSLGGSMAAAYAEKTFHSIDGLILLAAYSANDLSDKEFRVLSIYGSNDRVLNLDKAKENKKNLPAGSVEKVIEGGNHAQFGNYGLQKGDGTAMISTLEQQAKTVEWIDSFIQENKD